MLELAGIGTAVPARSIRQSAAARWALDFCAGEPERLRSLPLLYRNTQVRKRGCVVLEKGNGFAPQAPFFPPAQDRADRGPTTRRRMERYAQEAPRLALAAAGRALKESGSDPARISHLITVSCTGFSAPGVDVALIRKIGLPPEVARTHVGFMGCHGALNALRVAAAFGQADPAARILLCAVELCSIHFRYGPRPDALVANALFADGAAAVVAVPSAGGSRGGGAWRLAAAGSSLFPDSEEAMGWRIGDHGFEMSLSPQVPALIGRHLRPWLERWLRANGFRLSQIRSWAIHPGGPRILSAVADGLGLAPAAAADSGRVLSDCGNMSSPTILFILDRLRRKRSGRPCVALGFGPGLAAEAALLL